jgi:hypothetical protein
MKTLSNTIARSLGIAALCLAALPAAAAPAQPLERSGVSQDVLADVANFLGGAQGRYIDIDKSNPHRNLVSQQFNEAVSVPADPELVLDNGQHLMAGCRAHLCSNEKGAVLLDKDGKVLAVAILHVAVQAPAQTPARGLGANAKNQAQKPVEADVRYDFDAPVLTIFAQKQAASKEVREVFTAWVMEKLSREPAITTAQQASGKRHFSVETQVL